MRVFLRPRARSHPAARVARGAPAVGVAAVVGSCQPDDAGGQRAPPPPRRQRQPPGLRLLSHWASPSPPRLAPRASHPPLAAGAPAEGSSVRPRDTRAAAKASAKGSPPLRPPPAAAAPRAVQ